MIRIFDTQTAQESILRRPAWDEIPVPESLLAALAAQFGEPVTPDEAVRRILHDVRARGDEALRDWTLRLDGVQPPALQVHAGSDRSRVHAA